MGLIHKQARLPLHHKIVERLVGLHLQTHPRLSGMRMLDERLAADLSKDTFLGAYKTTDTTSLATHTAHSLDGSESLNWVRSLSFTPDIVAFRPTA